MRKLTITAAALSALTVAATAHAEPGDMLLKLRGGYSLRSQSTPVLVAVDNTPVRATASDAIGAEAALTFFLTDTLAAEVTLGGASYDLEDASGRTLSSGAMLTPALTLQYYPMPHARLRPYVGVGAAYVNFYSEKPGEVLTNRNVLPPVSYSTALKGNIAPVGQIGVDVAINDKLYINLDGKYLRASSKLTVAQGSTVQTVNHRMESFVVAVGAGFKF